MKNPGKELEEYIVSRLAEVDGWAHTTIASGAIFNDEDGRTSNYLFQAKDTTKRSNFIIPKADWDQLQSAALRERTPTGDFRVGIFVNRNSHDQIVVTLDLEDFIGILERINKNGKE